MKGLLQSKIFRKNLKKWLCMYVGALLLLTTVVTYSKYISKYNMDDESRVTLFDVKVENKAENKCNDINSEDCIKYRPTEEINYEFNINPTVEVNAFLVTMLTLKNDNFEIIKVNDMTNNKELYNKDDFNNKKGLFDGEKTCESNPISTSIENGYTIEKRKCYINGREMIETKTTKNNESTYNYYLVNEKITMYGNNEYYIYNSSDEEIKVTSNSNGVTMSRHILATNNTSKSYKLVVKYKYDINNYTDVANIKDQLNNLINVGYSATQEK